MKLELYEKIIEKLSQKYENFDYYIKNPTEDFKRDILEDRLLDFDFSNFERLIKVKFRYYQKLAIYFSNYYLKNQEILSEINTFKNQLAYWMATGSGKTIIMKADIISYLGFLKEKNKLNANSQVEIIITSSLTELISQLNIEFKEFIERIKKEFNVDIKLVIDTIQTLKNRKEYQSDNLQNNQFRLVLADEAHIGLGSDSKSYVEFKNRLVKNKENSFLFEYSATFNNVKDEDYYKKIVFEYGYGKFFNDFYGKDFKFGVIKADKIDEEKEIAENIKQNLDDFNKKLKAFYECEKFEDRPLLAVVGNSVKSKKESNTKADQKKREEELSDVLKFINYLVDLEDIKKYEKIFNTDKKTELYLIYNKQDDELLLAFNREKPFGLVNVGDTKSLINSLKNRENIKYEEINFVKDELKFKNIDKKNSPINILIGSRKFSAGWNSFRVSQICLINFGVGKGNTIIQIFGRGVRLKGLNNDGKRRMNYVDEASLKTEFKEYSDDFILSKDEFDKLKYLETLFIYSLKSTYLKNFIEESTDIFKQKIIKTQKIEKKGCLKSLAIKNNYDFSKIKSIKIEDGKVFFKYDNKEDSFDIDLKLSFFVKHQKELKIDDYLWDFIDKKGIEKFLTTKKFYIDFEMLKNLIENKNIIIFYDGKLTPKSFENLLYKAINAFEKYIEKQIEKKQKEYELKEFNYPYDEYKVEITLKKINENIDLYKKIAYEILDEIKKNSNCNLPEINTLKVVSKVKNNEKNIDIEVLFKEINVSISNPLALHPNKNKIEQKSLFDYIKEQDENIEKISIFPDSLDEWEVKFLEDLKKYVNKNNLTIKVLRNVPKKGSGIIGDEDDFYPDFIIEYKKDNVTHIIFCDPKGIRDASNYFKVCIVPYIVKEIQQQNIEFHSFVITHTSKKDIGWTPIKELEIEKSFEYFNLLFFDYKYTNGKTYIEKLFEKVENDNLKKELENINKIKDDKSLGDFLKYFYLLKDKFYKSKNLEIIKSFFEKFDKLKENKKEVQDLAKEYNINCNRIIKKEELLKMFLLKYIYEISSDEYSKICENFSSIKEVLKNKKELAFDMLQEVMSITGSSLILKIGKAIYEDFKRG